jgi:hypothetical protein
MPFDIVALDEEIDAEAEAIRDYTSSDDELAAEFRADLTSLHESKTSAELKTALSDRAHPGALPTERWDEADSLIETFGPIDGWDVYEEMVDWAIHTLDGVLTVGIDGSGIILDNEFTAPIGMVQAAHVHHWHRDDGVSGRELETELLSPDQLTDLTDDNVEYVKDSEVNHARYELEAQMAVEWIERAARLTGRAELAGDEQVPPPGGTDGWTPEHIDPETEGAGGEYGPLPVVFYDGPLTVGFAKVMDPATQQRYIEAITEVLAASAYYRIPVVGYVSGAKSLDLANMTRWATDRLLEHESVPRDAAILADAMDVWGDRTIPFVAQRDEVVSQLQTTYQGREYDFSEGVVFSYFDAPEGDAIDRVELPRWTLEGERDHVFEHVFRAVRAETAGGRGLPQMLISADKDAVLDAGDKKEFRRIILQASKEKDLGIEWRPKAYLKQTRR